MKKKFILSMVVALILSAILPNVAFAKDNKNIKPEVVEVIKEEFEIPLSEGLDIVGYSQHESTLTYYTDGAFDLVDHITEVDLNGDVIDKYIEKSTTKHVDGLMGGTSGESVLVESETIKDNKVIETYTATIYLPTEEELKTLLQESTKEVDNEKFRREMEDLLGKKVTDDMFITEEEAQKKMDSVNDPMRAGGIQKGYGNNYYTYNISNYDYSIQTLSAADYTYFLVSDNRRNLDGPENWSDAMAKMDNYAQSLLFMEQRKDRPKATDWLDVVASWVAVFGIAAGPPGWKIAATATVISALNSVFRILRGTTTQEAVEAKFAASMLNDLATLVAWGYITSSKSKIWYLEIPNTTKGFIQ